jgi:hypothetical protein
MVVSSLVTSVISALKWLAGNWSNTSRREIYGYILWVPIVLVLAAVEISAAAGWWDVPWPTISTTIGHLEDAWHPFALAVVVLIASVVLLAVAKGAPSLAGGRALPGTISGWSFTWDIAVIAIAITAGVIVDHSGSRFLYPGYWTYGIFAVFGIALPSFWALRTGKQPALFSTTRSLEFRLPWFRFVLGAGMAVLVFHLALYPWPDVAHQSTSIGNVSSGKAKRLAAAKYPPWSTSIPRPPAAATAWPPSGRTRWWSSSAVAPDAHQRVEPSRICSVFRSL